MSWILRDGLAQLHWNGWSALARLGEPQPSVEIQTNKLGDEKIPIKVVLSPHQPNLPETSSTLPIGDAYVRQNDLIATFPEREPWHFGYQVDLRVIDFHDTSTLIVEFWLSVQTSLLDSYPKIMVELLGFEPAGSSSTFLKDSSRCIGIMIHPLDQADCRLMRTVADAGLFRIEAFGRFMEKGVIRRARFRAVFADPSWSDEQWDAAFHAFVDSPLPLTT